MTARRTDDGKLREDLPCGCAFLYEPVPGTTTDCMKYHVRACNARGDDGAHRKQQAEKVSKAPKVDA